MRSSRDCCCCCCFSEVCSSVSPTCDLVRKRCEAASRSSSISKRNMAQPRRYNTPSRRHSSTSQINKRARDVIKRTCDVNESSSYMYCALLLDIVKKSRFKFYWIVFLCFSCDIDKQNINNILSLLVSHEKRINVCVSTIEFTT